MNAFSRQPAPIHIESDVSWVETNPGYWTVTLGGGDDSRAITQDGSGFIAWVGTQERHWCFSKALKACVENIQFHRDVDAEAQLAQDAAIASLMRMTPGEKARLIETLEVERAALDFAPGRMDVVARKTEKDRQIASLRRIS